MISGSRIRRTGLAAIVAVGIGLLGSCGAPSADISDHPNGSSDQAEYKDNDTSKPKYFIRIDPGSQGIDLTDRLSEEPLEPLVLDNEPAKSDLDLEREKVMREFGISTDPNSFGEPIYDSAAAGNSETAKSSRERLILYVSDLRNNIDIYSLTEEGGIRRLTDNPEADFDPKLSPDGRHIAFVSVRGGNFEIYRMGTDGSEQTNLTNNPAHDWYPSWTPDGNIIFSSDRFEGNNEICLMDPNGANFERLTATDANEIYPAIGLIGTEK